MTAQSLAVSEDFTASLADKLPVTLLFDYLGLGHLSLFVGLFDVAFDLAPVDDILARGGVCLVHGVVGRRLSLFTLARVFTLGHRG